MSLKNYIPLIRGTISKEWTLLELQQRKTKAARSWFNTEKNHCPAKF
jgi:hypothetical protein